MTNTVSTLITCIAAFHVLAGCILILSSETKSGRLGAMFSVGIGLVLGLIVAGVIR